MVVFEQQTTNNSDFYDFPFFIAIFIRRSLYEYTVLVRMYNCCDKYIEKFHIQNQIYYLIKFGDKIFNPTNLDLRASFKD